MTDGRLSESQLFELKDRHPCDQVAAQWVTLRKAGRKMVGPCPICSADRTSRTSTRFECDAEGWVCAVCPDGGDVIKLVQRVEDLEFREAVEFLGGARAVDADRAAKLEAEAKAKADRRERDSAYYRERERVELAGVYGDAVSAIDGTPAAEYLARRHLAVPRGAKIRSLSSLAYFESVGTPSRKQAIHHGPAMVAGIVDVAGRFAGLHMTYLDLAQPGGKLAIRHPETGVDLKAKKIRGSKGGGHIDLVPCDEPRALIVGEGIETTLSVWRAFSIERPADLAGVAFRAAIDLGNLAGRAKDKIRHPTLKTLKGRAQMIPGVAPDLDSDAIAIPPSVERVVILGDSDSDPLTTQCAVYRAAARYKATRALEDGPRPLDVVVAWPPAGVDFNDMAPDWSAILAVVDQAAPPAQPANSAADETDVAPRQRRARSSSAGAAGETDQSSPPDQSSAEAEKNFSAFDPPPTPPNEEENGAILAIDDTDGGGNRDDDDRIDEAALIEASALDHSDTDNAERLRLYFGRDLVVMAQSGVPGWGGQYLAWLGTHWDLDGGQSSATIIAQRVGDLIKAEADVMAATPAERQAIEAAIRAGGELQRIDIADESETASKRRAELEDLIDAGAAAKTALAGRKKERRKHAVTSKNVNKVDAMLRSLSHHLRTVPDEFNADPMLVATRTHTLRFVRQVDGDKVDARLDVSASHDRRHLITALVPIDYDPAATCPTFLANMERFQPNADQRRTVQQFAGLGLLGIPIQRIMFHYGTGGNFKSVFLEVITRTLGDSFAVGLPAESISGKEERSAGQASPDLERVFGKRMLRVLELPDGQPLQAGTVKKLTGGEKWPVRTLYKGYYEFQPRAKTHMSGNSLPHFDGSDGGMRRRLLIVEWPVTLKAEEQRDFEEVVGEIMAEAPGILNWLIDGALDYLRHGLFVAPSIAALTQEQIEEMDPIGQFFKDCVELDPSPNPPGVPAREMYRAYQAWSDANAKRVRSENKFGREMKKLCERDDKRVRVYVGVRLHDVPRPTDRGDDRDRRYLDEGPNENAPVL